MQSINTSLPLIRQCVQRLHIDISLLQEIWHPTDGSFNIRNYSQPITKIRKNGEGGGVAIVPHRTVKCVHLKEFDVDGLEAVWADVMTRFELLLDQYIFLPVTYLH